ncbi:Uncharacterised protein [uncultured archaeon]|nr:Uncharacterised protein [uncultured archaeon]
MINSKKANSRLILIILMAGILIVLIAIIINLYFMLSSNSPNPDSSLSSQLNNTRIEFDSNSVICGNAGDKHIRTFVKEIFEENSLIGIKYNIKDNSGKSYSYVVNDSNILPDYSGGVKRVDIIFSQAGMDVSLNITGVEAVPILKNSNGEETLGANSKSPMVCFSSCNDCSFSCDLICS